MEKSRVHLKSLRVKLPYGFKNKAERFLKDIAAREKLHKNIFIIFVNDSYIKKLNKVFLGKNKPTDVLSFDLGNEAEIYVSVDTAKRMALKFGVSPELELIRYALHGLLHIAGYDHKKSSMEPFMQKEEEDYLKIWESLY